MITVHRLNGLEIVINASHILTLEATPDTLVTLSTGEKILVREPLAEVMAKNTEYLRELGRGPILVPVPRRQDTEFDS